MDRRGTQRARIGVVVVLPKILKEQKCGVDETHESGRMNAAAAKSRNLARRNGALRESDLFVSNCRVKQPFSL